MIDLNTTWYLLIYVLLIGYAVLDGFDLGVGVLHLFARDEHERRIHFNSIGPVWDGNEVWLLTAGGALFAAFPPVYATVFSGFYLALMLLLVALIFRGVSFEFRGKVESAGWKRFWDLAFGLGSLVAALLLGVAFGNIIRGVPVNEHGQFVGTFLGLLNPFSLLVGVTGLVLLTLQGAAYLALKSEGALYDRVRSVIPRLWVAFIVLYAAATVFAVFAAGHLFTGLLSKPLFWVLSLLLLLALVYTPIAYGARKDLQTLLATSITIACVLGLPGVSMYPRLVPSSIDLAHSLTAYNACSTPRTLMVMLIIALIGLPIVLTYTICIYRIFRGKVKITEESY